MSRKTECSDEYLFAHTSLPKSAFWVLSELHQTFHTSSYQHLQSSETELDSESYTDDGYSGGNFDRPGWKEMLRQIEDGSIGTVIVKDMSRVGRDYL